MSTEGKKKLFVSNIDFEIDTEKLREMFEEFGSCVNIVIAYDKESKKSRGFAFVEMEAEDAALKAIEALNNKTVNGRPMKVTMDRGKNDGDESDSRGGSRSYAGNSTGGGDFKKPVREFLPPIQRMQLFKRTSKSDYFLENPVKKIDYRDVATLSKFVSERGRILSRRLTGLNAFHQRQMSKAIKRAQSLGLMPYTR